MILSLLLACQPTETAVLAPCTLEADPEVGTFTEEFASQHEVACSDAEPLGFAIYVGRVDAVDGASADLSFRKAASNPSSAPLASIEWFVVEDPDGHHECADAGTDDVRASGAWLEGDAVLEVPNVAVYPSQEALEDAPQGETVHLYLVTTGSDEPGVRRWWQKDNLSFTRTCPEDDP